MGGSQLSISHFSEINEQSKIDIIYIKNKKIEFNNIFIKAINPLALPCARALHLNIYM